MAPPTFDDDPGLAQAIEDFAVEHLVTQAGVEAFDITILPGASGRDVGGLGADGGNPAPDGACHELGAIIGSDVARHAAQDEEIG